MKSNIETGHAKNISNFQDLLAFVTDFGATYNPSKVSLQLPALTTQHAQAHSALNSLTTASVAYNNAVNSRVALFQPIRLLGTRLLNALIASDATTETIKDARTINRKLQGVRAAAKATLTDPNAPAPLSISVSQQSYDKLIDHLTKLTELLKSEPSYNPNEPELSVTDVSNYINNLEAENNKVSTAYAAVTNARILRNNLLYKPKKGLVDTALDVKSYVKSVFGAKSQEFKYVNKIKFRNIAS